MPRLDQVLSKYNLYTRSQSKKIVRKQGVRVNGSLVRDEKHSVTEGDFIDIGDINFVYQKFIYLMMNKQKDRECSHDSHGLSIYDDINQIYPNDLFSVGRLDKDTTGLLLLTNDGQWAHQITQKNNDVLKVYLVTTDKDIEKIEKLLEPIDLKEDGFVQAKTLKQVSKNQILLGITDGKYHQVKRMVKSIGYEVIQLHRVSIGNLVLDANLKPGEIRVLTRDELQLVHDKKSLEDKF